RRAAGAVDRRQRAAARGSARDRDRARRLSHRGRHRVRREPGRCARIRHQAVAGAGAGRTQAGAARPARVARRHPGGRAGAVAGAGAAAARVGELSPAVDDVNALLGERTFGFEHPAWLLALLAAPVLWLLTRRSLADFSPAQLRVQALLRTLLLAGVAAALAGPTLRRPARAVSAGGVGGVSGHRAPRAPPLADHHAPPPLPPP